MGLLSEFGRMLTIAGAFDNFMSSLTNVFRSFSFPIDLIDIIVMAYIIYHGIRLVRETRAMQLVKGIVAVLVIYFVANQLNMITLRFFINILLQVGIVILAVLFQPELRSALERMGRSGLPIMRFGQVSSGQERGAVQELIRIITQACVSLSGHKTGGLIVIERDTRLGDVIKTGTIIDSEPSVELIGNVFFTNSPLHDGAMVIRGGRLYAAGCYLPLSQNMEIARELGTRHRAALGMSEVSDAVVVVVSEETGAITIACDSKLQRGLSEKNLQKLLELKLLPLADEQSGRKFGFWRMKK